MEIIQNAAQGKVGRLGYAMANPATLFRLFFRVFKFNGYTWPFVLWPAGKRWTKARSTFGFDLNDKKSLYEALCMVVFYRNKRFLLVKSDYFSGFYVFHDDYEVVGLRRWGSVGGDWGRCCSFWANGSGVTEKSCHAQIQGEAGGFGDGV